MKKEMFFIFASLFALNGCASFEDGLNKTSGVLGDIVAVPFFAATTVVGAVVDGVGMVTGGETGAAKHSIDELNKIRSRYSGKYPPLEKQIEISRENLGSAYAAYKQWLAAKKDYDQAWTQLKNAEKRMRYLNGSENVFAVKIAEERSHIDMHREMSGNNVQELANIKGRTKSGYYEQVNCRNETQMGYTSNPLMPIVPVGDYVACDNQWHERTSAEHAKWKSKEVHRLGGNLEHSRRKIAESEQKIKGLLQQHNNAIQQLSTQIPQLERNEQVKLSLLRQAENRGEQECTRITRGKEIHFSYYSNNDKVYKDDGLILPGSHTCLLELFQTHADIIRRNMENK